MKNCIYHTEKSDVSRKKVTSYEEMDDEQILKKLIVKRREKKNNKEEYQKIIRDIRSKCIKAKEDWLNKQFNNIEINYIKDTKDMHKQNNDLTGRKFRITQDV